MWFNNPEILPVPLVLTPCVHTSLSQRFPCTHSGQKNRLKKNGSIFTQRHTYKTTWFKG